MFDVTYRVLPAGEWRRYGVSLPRAQAEAFARKLECSRNAVRYEAAAVSLDTPKAQDRPARTAIAA